jgi:hypothetical protein
MAIVEKFQREEESVCMLDNDEEELAAQQHSTKK